MTGLYLKLAAVGIRKNGRHYTPYILTAAIMVGVLYIISFLSANPLLDNMRGGSVMSSILTVGIIVMAIFSAIFLFYTNSFLIKRRKKEFGLYNILGLKKNQIARVLIWESLIVYALSVIGGLGLGILFSKLAELLAIRMLRGNINYQFSVDPVAVIAVLIVFAIIFTLILMNSLRQLFFSRPIELLRSGSVGEKPPRTNVPFAVLGLLLLGGAYYMAITIEQPSAAIVAFMIAVIMVILATYLLFIAGSIVLCAALRKNKSYYYKTKHFVSVSQMAYRMRRNGAGLASICILSTMVLVTLSSTATLYMGVGESVMINHPTDIQLNFYSENLEKIDRSDEVIRKYCAENSVTMSDIDEEYYVQVFNQVMAATIGYAQTETYIRAYLYAADTFSDEKINSLSLAENEFAYVEPFSSFADGKSTLNFKGFGEVKMTRLDNDLDIIDDYRRYTTNGTNPDPVILMFCDNRETLARFREAEFGEYKSSAAIYRRVRFNVNAEMSDDDKEEFCGGLSSALLHQDFDISFNSSTQAQTFAETVGVYGGLFFLGILLGGVFLLAAVLIMYYKQITEGFEDASRFEILRKVGMTRAEIKSSINSQVLTVFFLPLAAAGVHMAFAFPILARMLKLFDMNSTWLFALVVLGVYLIFAAVYTLVYKATSKSYSMIVNK